MPRVRPQITRETSRILLAWGPCQPLESRIDTSSYLGERPGCRVERADGFACWGDVRAHGDFCWRHTDKITEDFIEIERRIGKLPGSVDDMPSVYFITGAGKVKIGKTTGDPILRLATLQCGSPVDLRLERFVRTPDPYGLEKTLHQRYAQHRTNGEWFEALPVLADLGQLTNIEVRSLPAPRPLRIDGAPLVIARWFGSGLGRHVSRLMRAGVLDVEVRLTAHEPPTGRNRGQGNAWKWAA